jgi:ATP-dependent DNA helicase RecG
MVIEEADRFGLAQLHQLRGRVGRGEKPSVCVLIGDASTDDGRKRLEAMAETNSGFVLAERDLEIRGPGELLGARQSGLPPFRVADLTRDLALLAMARRDAAAWIDHSPRLDRPEDALARRRLMKQYGHALGIADVG